MVKTTCIFVLFLIFPTLLFAQENSFLEDFQGVLIKEESDWLEKLYATLGFQSGYFRGNSIYHINFDNPQNYGGHGESELEWLIDNPLIGIFGSIHYRKEMNIEERKDRARLDLSWYTNITEDTGKKMRDSDWIENDVEYIDWNDDGDPDNNSAVWAWNNPGKDLYGELDCYLERANIFEVSCVYNFFVIKMLSIGLVGGWRYHKFKFYGKNLEQNGYGPYAQVINAWMATVSDNTISSKWIEYEAKHQIPYLGIATDLSLGEKLKLNIKLGYSDWAKIKDTDTHLYPDWDAANPGFDLNMVSTSQCKGDAYLGELEGIWGFLPNWTFSIGVSYIDIDTKGTLKQFQYINGVLQTEVSGISDKVSSEYWLINGVIKYIF